MESEKIIKWIASIEESGQEEKRWEALGEQLQPFLKPIRDKMIRDQQKLLEFQNLTKILEAEVNFYKEAIRNLPNPIFIKDEDTRFLFFNKKYEDIFGIKSREFIGKKVYDLEFLSIESRLRYQSEDEKMIVDSSVIHYEMPFEIVDGTVLETLYWSKGFIVKETGGKGLIGEIVDISKEKNLQRELVKNVNLLKEANKDITAFSKTDMLTGIFNRCVLVDSFNEMVNVFQAQNKDFSTLLIDIDHFKTINDVYGHLVGDEVLKKFVSILKGSTRGKDICIRYGGEEFLIFFPNTGIEQARTMAEVLCEKLHNYPILPNHKNITASIGVTQYKKGEKLETLVRRADNAMYNAKESGRDRVCVLV